MKCARCTHKKCFLEGQNCTKIGLAEVEAAYVEDRLQLMKAAACTEGRFYGKFNRLEETAEFCKLMGYEKIGMAFCNGLKQEAKIIDEYFSQFFEVDSVCCKVCGIGKDALSLEQIRENARETMCNPVMQAKILQEQAVEFCITVGLCVGHDALFTGACTVPVSCLVVKDRVLAHNPLGAVYSRFCRKKLGIDSSDQG